MEDKTVRLSLKTLIRECSLNPNLFLDHDAYFSLKNRENVHEVFRYKKFNDDFTDTVCCYRKDDELIGIVRPSYDEFLEKLCHLLNVPVRGVIQDNETLTHQLLDRVEVLKSTQTEDELRLQFPLLYKDLQDGRSYYQSLLKIRRDEGYGEEEFASGEHYFYGCGMKRSLENFIKTQSVLYERFILKRLEFKSLTEKTSYNSYIRKHFDLNKLAMYVMHKYLCICEGTSDKEVIKKYVALVERYIASSHDKTVSLMTEEGIQVNYQMICNRLSNVKRVISDNSSIVEWILVPEGRDYSRVKQENASKVTTMNFEEIRRLEALGERKRTFYESSPYLAKVLGLRRYHGYVGYIYENGEVVLDREYLTHHPSSASGDAIYIIKANDFEKLSRCDKQELRNHPRVRRMNHTSTWEARLQRVINHYSGAETLEETKQLIKKLKEKRD